MFKKFLSKFIVPEINEQAIQKEVNRRVAETLSKMDPFEPLMKKFHGVFGEEFERPEEQLNESGRFGMLVWGWQQKHDPSFKYMTDWIMNTQANESLKRAPVTPERILYARAQISTMILFVKEIGRLSNLYEELRDKNKAENLDEGILVE